MNSQTFGASKVDISKYAAATTGFPIKFAVVTPEGQDAKCVIVDGTYVEIRHAGDCVIQADQDGKDGDGVQKAQAATAVRQTMTIAKKPLTLTAVATPNTKTYAAAAFDQATFKVTSTDWAYTDTDAGNHLGGTLAYAVTNAAGNINSYPGAGFYVLTPTGLTSPNYEITFATAALTINKALATVTLGNLTQQYDGAAKQPTVTTDPAGLETFAFVYTVDGVPMQPVNAGVYNVVATLSNVNYLGSAEAFLSIYDPNGGFVTGGGWINSPAGACRNWAACTTETVGKANFGFVSKYVQGKSAPTGNTVFQFHAGNLKFKSTSYETLVVSGDRAQYWGFGSVNGVTGYRFRLAAVDAQSGTDKFRMEIWQGTRDTGTKVYDNQWGDAQDAGLRTEIAGGSIQIKK